MAGVAFVSVVEDSDCLKVRVGELFECSQLWSKVKSLGYPNRDGYLPNPCLKAKTNTFCYLMYL